MARVVLAASMGELFLTGLVSAIPASILTVVVSWLAILRRKVEARVDAQVALELSRQTKGFEDQLQRRRDRVMRVLEKEYLERLDQIMGSAYRARNAVRELASDTSDTDARSRALQELTTEGNTLTTQITENRVRLIALSSFDDAHALKNALLAVARAAKRGAWDDITADAALVETCFQQFNNAITAVIEPDRPESADGYQTRSLP